MEKLLVGNVVESTKGRDEGKVYIVIDVIDQFFVLVADGIKKTVSSPKRKNIKHLKVLGFVRLSMDDVKTDPNDTLRRIIDCHIKEVRLPDVKK